MKKAIKRISVSQPDLSLTEKKYLNDAFDSSWISSKGKYIDRFEQEFAKLCQVKHAIAVSNGTVALHLALLALDVRPGDEVIIPSLTYIATANAVRYVGAEPVFVDVNPNYWCLDPSQIKQAITKRTKGIIAVNLYGHPADMNSINAIAAEHNLWVVEDAAESHTATYHGKPAGGLAKIGTFSFYGNKIFSSGEGGALTLNDDQLAKKIRLLKGQGMDPLKQYYFPIVGYNFRLTNIAAAILCGQLERSKEIIDSRNRVFSLYKKYLNSVPGVSFQPTEPWATVAPWFFSILIDKQFYGMNRDQLIKKLEQHNIETRPFFIPIHQLPPYRKKSKKDQQYLPVTQNLSEHGMNLPTYSSLSENEIRQIAEIITKG